MVKLFTASTLLTLGVGLAMPLAAKASLLDLASAYGTASQSSTAFSDPNSYHGSGPASRAIDGNTDGNYYDGSVSHTGNDVNAFWQVSLGRNYSLSDIKIWNRTDCCTNRLENFTVSVMNSLGATEFSQSYPGPVLPTLDIPFTTAITGETVKVELNGQNYLHLAEVQVFGGPANNVPEPASLALLVTALAATGAISRQRRVASARS